MSVPHKLWKLVPSAAAGAAAFTIMTGPAHGFFPPVTNPGTGPVTVTPPPPPPIPVVPIIPLPPVGPLPVTPVIPIPPAPPPVFPPPPGVGPGEVPDPPPTVPPPSTVPEPATIVSGVIGLGVLGGLARMRRRNEKPA